MEWPRRLTHQLTSNSVHYRLYYRLSARSLSPYRPSRTLGTGRLRHYQLSRRYGHLASYRAVPSWVIGSRDVENLEPEVQNEETGIPKCFLILDSQLRAIRHASFIMSWLRGSASPKKMWKS